MSYCYSYTRACKCQLFTDEGSCRLLKRLNYCFSILASAMNQSIILINLWVEAPEDASRIPSNTSSSLPLSLPPSLPPSIPRSLAPSLPPPPSSSLSFPLPLSPSPPLPVLSYSLLYGLFPAHFLYYYLASRRCINYRVCTCA